MLMFFGILLRLPWIWTVTATYWIPITKSLQAAAYYKNVLSLSISDAVGTNIRSGSVSAAKQTTKSIIRRIDSFKGAIPGSPRRSPSSRTQSLRETGAIESLGGSVMHTSLRQPVTFQHAEPMTPSFTRTSTWSEPITPSLSPQRQSPRTGTWSSPRMSPRVSPCSLEGTNSSPQSPSGLFLKLSPRMSPKMSPRVSPCPPEGVKFSPKRSNYFCENSTEGNNLKSSLELTLPTRLRLDSADSVEDGAGGNAETWDDAALQEKSKRAGGALARMAEALQKEDAT